MTEIILSIVAVVSFGLVVALLGKWWRDERRARREFFEVLKQDAERRLTAPDSSRRSRASENADKRMAELEILISK